MSTRAFGTRLKSLRQRRRMTQAQLASAAKLSAGYVARLERGEQDPSLSVLRKLGRALRVKPAALLD